MRTQHKTDMTEAEVRDCPWSDLNPAGKMLVLHDFPTKRVITLRRQVTLP